ncbi:MAG: serine hydrolase domain-containing protein [Candidatus Sericytochromatia bacterium]
MSTAWEALCAQWFQSQRLPGLAVGLQHGEQTVWAGQWGQAQLELGVPTGPETVFEIASVTKLFTTEAVLKAVQAGQLRLDDRLGQHLKGLPAAWQDVQVQQILTHQSGLRNYTAVPEYWLHTREDLPASHILNLVRDLPLDFAPGDQYAYDNTGFYLLGLLLEAVAGLSYAEVLQRQIFRPLGMHATRANDYRQRVPQRAAGYSLVEGEIVNKVYYSPTGTFAAGCLLSSVADLLRWSARLHDPDWLDPALRQACWTPRPSRAGNERQDGLQLGLGWFEVQTAQGPFWGHNGGIQGFSSSLIHLPESRWTAVVLSNGDWAAEPHLLARELLHMAQ